MAMRYAHEVISVSRHGAATLEKSHGRAPTIILNGVPKIDPTDSVAVLDELRLTPGRYVLHVGRAIVDKRQDDLIRAFARAGLKGWKLVLVGDYCGEDAFSRAIRLATSENPDNVLAGFRCGVDLRTLFTNAGGFALPSVIEGFPIALLEALSAGCPVIASDIPANHEIELPAECYFPVGDIEAMASALSRMSHAARSEAWAVLREKVRAECDWAKIAQQTLRLYTGGNANKKLPASTAQGQRQ